MLNFTLKVKTGEKELIVDKNLETKCPGRHRSHRYGLNTPEIFLILIFAHE